MSSGGLPIAEVQKLYDNYAEWTQQLGIWIQTNSHLHEGQKVGLVLMALKGPAKTVGLNLHRDCPGMTMQDLVRALRKHFVPDEMAHTILKTGEFYSIEKHSGETLAKFLGRFVRVVNSVRRRGMVLDDRQVYAKCIQAIKPTADFKASILTQCPNDTYSELRSFLRRYANFQAESESKQAPRGSRKAFVAVAPATKDGKGKKGGKGKGKGSQQAAQGKCFNCGGKKTQAPARPAQKGAASKPAEKPFLCWKCGKPYK